LIGRPVSILLRVFGCTLPHVSGIWENAMMSARRTAQLGIVAASLLLVSSITVLVAGSVDQPETQSSPVDSSSSHVTPLATDQLAGFQGDVARHVASDKQ
jgi:hypothetical protein